MKKLLLASFLLSIGMSVAFAQTSIPGRIDGDLYFNDQVYISSGVDYPDDIDGDTGSSTVTLEGEGSLTIGKRIGEGFPRVVIYGGTTLTVAQDFTDVQKNWWTGNIKAPNTFLDIPVSLISWANESNHTLSEINIAGSFGFESVTDTYSFSSEAYVVLPVDVPNGAKIWYAFHSIDPQQGESAEEEVIVVESDFCVIENGLCVVPVTEMNQITLIEESFQRCPRNNVPNGEIGSAPYCIISCNAGYELDDNAISCDALEETAETIEEESSQEVMNNDEGMFPSASTNTISGFDGLSGEALEKALEQARLQSIGKKDYQSGHYRDDMLTLIDTSNLSGDQLREALRRNAQINRRRGSQQDDVSSSEVSALTKIVNDISSKLWSWENRNEGGSQGVANADSFNEIELGAQAAEDEGTSESFYASAPFLPSTGSSTLFIIISILGIGLMMMALRRR